MLNNHTYYSLRYGSLSIKELLEEASKNALRDHNGWGSFVLTDINTTSAVLDFVRLAPTYQIRPIVGIRPFSSVIPTLAPNKSGSKPLSTLGFSMPFISN